MFAPVGSSLTPDVRFELQSKRERRCHRPAAKQGPRRVDRSPAPAFDPASEIDAACDFFGAHGYVVLSDCLDAGELTFLNDFCERTQRERPDAWGLGRRKPHHTNQGLIFSQPLLDYPELDAFTASHRSYPVVARLLGGADHVRYAEFNFRETPEGAGERAMNFHHDAVVADRFTRAPYMPCDFLCSIHYLSDVEPGSPSFCVVPDSRGFDNLQAAFDGLGEAYREVPLYGPAGTMRALRHGDLHPTGRRRPPDAAHLARILCARRLAAHREPLYPPAQPGAHRLEPDPRTPGAAPGPADPRLFLALEHGAGRMGRQRLRPRGPQGDAHAANNSDGDHDP